MARQTVIQKHWRYVVNTDADLPLAQRPWALVKTDLRDELTSEPVTSPARVTSDHPEFTGVARTDGGAGLMGVPANVLPKLKTTNYPGTISVDAEGYVPDSQSFTILSNVLFPDDFQPLDLGTWPLHRQPISIYGRVNLLTGTTLTPVAGAQVAITKIWRKAPSAGVSPPPDPFVPASLRPPLSAPRPVGATVTHQPLTPVASTFVLLANLQSGDSSLNLSDTVGLGVGQILAFDRTDLERREFAEIAAITGSAGPNEPATVQLRFPLAYPHAKVEHVTPGIAGPANTLGVAAIAGDTALLATSLTGIGSPDLVEIAGGVAANEYRGLFRFSVVTDARGLYRFPPLSRVAQLELTANDGVHLPAAQILIPDYRQEEYRADFTMR